MKSSDGSYVQIGEVSSKIISREGMEDVAAQLRLKGYKVKIGVDYAILINHPYDSFNRDGYKAEQEIRKSFQRAVDNSLRTKG